MRTYWIIGLISQHLFGVLFLITAYAPQRHFGSQGYSGYGQALVMVILLGLTIIAVLNTLAASSLAYNKQLISLMQFGLSIGSCILIIIVGWFLILGLY